MMMQRYRHVWSALLFALAIALAAGCSGSTDEPMANTGATLANHIEPAHANEPEDAEDTVGDAPAAAPAIVRKAKAPARPDHYRWTLTFGGRKFDFGRSVAVDSGDHVYLLGSFEDVVDFNPDAEIASPRRSLFGDSVFIVKITAEGRYLWSKALVSTTRGFVKGNHITVDPSDNVYITGSFGGGIYYEGMVDFDPDPEADDLHFASGRGSDAYVTRFNADGSYGWTRTWGGADGGACGGTSLASDHHNNVYVVGFFSGAVDFGIIDTDGCEKDSCVNVKRSQGAFDVFVTRIDKDGRYAWTRTYGGGATDAAYAIAVDSRDNVYLGGFFQRTVTFNRDWIAEARETGDADGAGAVTRQADAKTSRGGADAFITKIYANGDYAWTRRIGGEYHEAVHAIAVDSRDAVIAVGNFFGAVNFNVVNDPPDMHEGKSVLDLFVTALSAQGEYRWTRVIGGEKSATDDAGVPLYDPDADPGDGYWTNGFYPRAFYSVAVDSRDTIYLAGDFCETVDFDPGPGRDLRESVNRGFDSFVTALAPDGAYRWTRAIQGYDNSYCTGLAVDSRDNLYLAGYFYGRQNFNTDGRRPDSRESAGKSDAFVTSFRK